ncbi:MAG: cupin domain-containing protein [Anaerolineae bacterium]|nr:cupin domain-containing protein [Anaerolineae bacterium]
MNVVRRNSAPRYMRDNIVSYLLISKRTCDSDHLAITLVEMEPGGVQHIHSHEPEQMYYILEGSGVMTVDGEQQPVRSGDCIFFSSFAKHGLENTGSTVLRYLSACSPSFTPEQCEQLWPLESLDDEKS